jgi:geranylgeranyl reductase
MSIPNEVCGETYDVVVVGGGPSGATAAHDLALTGRSVLLLDKAGRIKPCGGAIPPRLVRDFHIPDHLLVARATSARMISPSTREVDMPIEGGFVGMVDRDVFDEWLRSRAAGAGAERRTGTFERIERDADGRAVVCYKPKGAADDQDVTRVRARSVIGADGARSQLARQTIKGGGKTKCVFAYLGIRRNALRRLLPGPPVARLLRLDFPARRYREHRRWQRTQRLLPARRGKGAQGHRRATGL